MARVPDAPKKPEPQYLKSLRTGIAEIVESEAQAFDRLAHEYARKKFAYCKNLYAASFEDFAKAAWPIIDPAKLQWSWHHTALAGALQATTEGKIKNLLINIAPGHSKSSLLSVLWPAWEWIRNPGQTFLSCSYGENLALRDAAQCRRLVESPWYQRYWGDKVQLVEDANQIERYKTKAGGHRVSGTPFGRGMGEGGNRCIIDDPHSSDDDGVTMDKVWTWYTGTFFNRLRDPKNGARIICGQRLALRDLSGHILEAGGYVHLFFQEEYDPEHRCKIDTPTFKWDGDPRKEKGDPLWPERYGREEIEDLKCNTPVNQYSARYQQIPVPAGGFQFRREWFQYFHEVGDINGSMYVLTTKDASGKIVGTKTFPVSKCRRISVVDPACAAKRVGNRPCFTVCQVFDITPDNDLLLLYLYRKQEESPKVVDDLNGLMTQFTIPFFWVEKNGIGVPTIQFCLKAGIPVRGIEVLLGKKDRAQAAEILMGNGKVFFRKGSPWLPALEREIEQFPQGDYADSVDALAHACSLLRGQQQQPKKGTGVVSMSGSTGVAVNTFRSYAPDSYMTTIGRW